MINFIVPLIMPVISSRICFIHLSYLPTSNIASNFSLTFLSSSNGLKKNICYLFPNCKSLAYQLESS